MSTCSYNYRLQWLYGGDVPSVIISWFCAYCAHSTGIYTPSQKIHGLFFSKVYMWLVVEEVRAYQLVVA